jgi:asparagine synthetase B (glutamine-hydrolysing)
MFLVSGSAVRGSGQPVVVCTEPAVQFGDAGRDRLVFSGVVYPDTGRSVDDVLRLCRQRAPVAEWRSVKGRYAGAHVDLCTGELTVFTDHVGVHDVYAWQAGPDSDVTSWAVSDDFAALARSVPGPARRLDRVAAEQYLAFGFTVNGRTLAEGIRRLPPGARVRVADGRTQREAVWSYIERERHWTIDDAVDECWALLGRAASRVRAVTGPRSRGLLGLSGGRDSRVSARVCLDAGIDVRPYFFGERVSEAAEVAEQVGTVLGLKVHFPERNREFPSYFERSVRSQPLADLEWCKYPTGRGELVADVDAILSGHLGDHVFGVRSFRSSSGPGDDRSVARELFYSCAKEKTDADAVDRIIDEVSVQVAAIGGSVSQRKQGFAFHTVNMGVKQCGLFRDFSGVPHYSLFEDVDVIDAALAIPASWRLRNRFYQRMFARYLPELDVGEIRAPGRSNDHKPVDEWLRGNTRFADAVCDLIDPDEDTGLPGNYRTFAEAVTDIIAGRSTKNDIHAFFRRLTIGSYQRHYE